MAVSFAAARVRHKRCLSREGVDYVLPTVAFMSWTGNTGA